MTAQFFLELKKTSQTFRTDTFEIRRARLQKLLNWINQNEEEIFEALNADFNKPRFETTISEIYPCTTELAYAIKNLKKWMKDKKVSTPLGLIGHKSHIRYENKGVVLIISPWNYPFQLAVVPLISALAAGNTATIKPSELTPHTSALIAKMITTIFEPNEVCVELGGKERTEELLKYKFDHVFFTGSTAVGKIIATACAEQLIPTTLELGGKSPTIIDETADLNEAADKIFWGKYLNRAQTCVAPDYLIAHESICEELVQKIQDLAQEFDTQDKAKVITKKHHERFQKMLSMDINLNQKTLALIEAKNTNAPTMQDEIFGPVLPYIKYKNINEISQHIMAYEKPLALYIFSKNKENINKLLNEFSSGGVGINCVLLQFGNHHLPFGGIGHSGSGEYHGYYGFVEMSHQRAVIVSHYFSFLRKLLMPPYTSFKHNVFGLIKRF